MAEYELASGGVLTDGEIERESVEYEAGTWEGHLERIHMEHAMEGAWKADGDDINRFDASPRVRVGTTKAMKAFDEHPPA